MQRQRHAPAPQLPHTRVLIATLPEGFTELGRRRLKLDYLEQQLLPIAQRHTHEAVLG